MSPKTEEQETVTIAATEAPSVVESAAAVAGLGIFLKTLPPNGIQYTHTDTPVTSGEEARTWTTLSSAELSSHRPDEQSNMPTMSQPNNSLAQELVTLAVATTAANLTTANQGKMATKGKDS